VSKPIYNLFHIKDVGSDLLFLGPTKKCVCGNELFQALIWFDETDNSIGGYFTEMVCVSCGSLVRGVTEDPDETGSYDV